jgi:diguanylate cyclase (GGDEF)-like protein/PAS domain S-box-containing protein
MADTHSDPPDTAGADLAQLLAAAQAELADTQRMLDDAQRLAQLGSWESDMRTGKMIWSEEMYRIHGYAPGEVEPTRAALVRVLHPDDLPIQQAQIAELMQRPGTTVEKTVRINLPSGEERTLRIRATLVLDGQGNELRAIGTCQDITDEERGRRAEALLGQIVVSSSEAIVTVDAEMRINGWNPAAERLYGYSAQEIVGKSADVLLPSTLGGEERNALQERRRRLLTGVSNIETFEDRRLRSDGSAIYVHVTSAPLRDPKGDVIGIVTTVRDITERRRVEEQLAHISNHDPLTGLFNRIRFKEELAAASARAQHEGHRGALMILDLDNFKYVNESFGHNTGDSLMAEIAGALSSKLRETDVLARLGGDEFAILILPCDASLAGQIADQLMEAVRNHTMVVDGHTLRVTASLGCATFGTRPGTPLELMADADRAMHESKESGRDRVTVYSDSDRINLRRRARPAGEHLIRDALEHDHFELFAHPIVSLRTGVMTHVEVLLRLRRDGHLVSPGEFMPAAERLGLMHLIDYWVIERALSAAASFPDLMFDINLSGFTIDDTRLEGFIADQLRNSGTEPHRVVFELTETGAIGNVGRAQALARRLTDMGCRFAIDDFGSGFSTFYYLKHFPAQFVKIDGEFINDQHNRTDAVLVDSIVRIARDLGKKTVAEYVADAATLERVRNLGVDFAQGYHFAEPFPIGQLSTMPRQLLEPARSGPPQLTFTAGVTL